jgi:proteasome lid subunit RPN8/RPN11
MLLIEWPVLSEMLEDVESYQSERCGFLFGFQEADSVVIYKIMPVSNTTRSDKRTNYEISARDYLIAERLAELAGIKLLGVYHSHLNHPAIPSELDRQFALPNFVYIIFSVNGNRMMDIRSWQLDQKKQFEESKIDYIPSSSKNLKMAFPNLMMLQ